MDGITRGNQTMSLSCEVKDIYIYIYIVNGRNSGIKKQQNMVVFS